MAIQLRVPETTKGVVIAAVNPSSDAAQKGLQRGDIILSVNQQPVTTPQEAANAVAATRQAGRDSVLLLVQRGPTPGRRSEEHTSELQSLMSLSYSVL